ncbi:MAG: amino acid ABC transporter substrate-binding protein [bacterium]|nr:amino acid ABC transporter substrate-binding protein [bacterium]
MKHGRHDESLQRGVSAVAVILAVLCSGPAATRAADDDPSAVPAIGNLTWNTITDRDGLPDDSVRAISVDGARVWVGTDRGTALFDGSDWSAWPQSGTGGNEPPAPVSAIDVDARTGDVWMGTWGGGLMRLTGGRMDRFDQFNSGLAGDLIYDVLVADGRVWAATNGGISAFDPVCGNWRLHLARRADRPESLAVSLAPGAADGLLEAGVWCEGTVRIDLTTGQEDALEGLPANLTDGSTTGPSAFGWSDGCRWWATPHRLFRRDQSGRWQWRAIGGGDPAGETVHWITPRSESEAWLGTDRGLIVLADWDSDTWIDTRRHPDDEQPQVTVIRSGQIIERRLAAVALPSERIRCIAFQNETVWIGTPAGLVCGRPAHAITATRSEKNGLSKSKPAFDGDGPAECVIGVLSPTSKTMLLPGGRDQYGAGETDIDLPAVQLALAEANQRGGFRGQMPFALAHDIYGYARYGWGLPEDGIAKLGQMDGVCGIIGHLGPDSRQAMAAVLHSELPLINAARTPATIDERVNPWAFRCPGKDPHRQKQLLDYVFDQLGMTRLALLRPPGRVDRAFLDLAARHARERGHPPVADVPYDPAGVELNAALEEIRRSRPDVLLTRYDAETSAAIVKAMRRAGMDQLVMGSEHLVTADFANRTDGNPGPVLALWACRYCGDADARTRFVEAYRARMKRSPSPQAYRSYDAARYLLSAIDLAGPDREAIRRTLQVMQTAAVARLERGGWRFINPTGNTDDDAMPGLKPGAREGLD